MEVAKVFFTQDISPRGLIKIYDALGVKLNGKIGVKISTGEPGGHNYLKSELIGGLVKKLNGTIVECCTAYGGKRQDPKEHWQTIKDHGFLNIAPCDILDEYGEFEIPVNGGKHLDVDIVGEHMKNYDAFVNLAHFKGHAMGGFGGVIKNQSIGFASTAGKAYIHTAGKTRKASELWDNLPIDVMNNLSVDCDCDSSPEDPCMKDIGILASLDPVALDQACIDKIWTSTDRGRDHFIARVERQNGRHILPYAEGIGLGSRKYELINID